MSLSISFAVETIVNGGQRICEGRPTVADTPNDTQTTRIGHGCCHFTSRCLAHACQHDRVLDFQLSREFRCDRHGEGRIAWWWLKAL